MLINTHTHHFTGQAFELMNGPEKNHPERYYSAGIHPFDSFCDNHFFKKVFNELHNPNCLAVGEAGLDRLKGPDLKIQIETFQKQVEWSEELKMPVIIHCVKAWNELKVIKREINPTQTWIYHGFSKVAILNEVLNENLIISVGSAILTNEKLQESIKLIPNDRLFLETDDSSFPILELYLKVCELKNLTLHELEQIIENNFKKVFTKWTIGSKEQNY